jgi:hypothetical protein
MPVHRIQNQNNTSRGHDALPADHPMRRVSLPVLRFLERTDDGAA